jgi:DNA-binding NarL/FixJ family response regulator
MPINPAPPIRLLLVDDHAILRAGLRMLLEDQPNMAVIGEAGGREEALTLAARELPDIILLDLDLGTCLSTEFLPDLMRVANGTKVIILTGVQNSELHHRAIQDGAIGLVLKDQACTTLIKAIEKVSAGEAWLDRSMIAKALTRALHKKATMNDSKVARFSDLTNREKEIVLLVAQGLHRKHIASQLFISEATVRNHLTAILGKLGLTNSFDLALFAYRNGLAKPPS